MWPTELSDADGPARPNYQLPWPACVRSSDFVRPMDLGHCGLLPDRFTLSDFTVIVDPALVKTETALLIAE